MKIILVDDDPIGLVGFEIECGSLPQVELVGKFTSPSEALSYVENHEVDCALIDIVMPEMSGFELCKKLKQLRSEMVVVFVTANTKYAVEAINSQADYTVFKPYDKEKVEEVFSRISYYRPKVKKRMYCRTFGRFDVFIDDKPVIFRCAKAKEILALCVHRQGAALSAEEIIDILWPEYTGKPGSCSSFRFTIKQLVDTLKGYKLEDAFGREKGLCYINKEYVGSDYYDFLEDDPEAICNFQGEFMSNYSWGENSIFALMERKQLKKT